MRVLFLLPYSREAASCRYRVHQFVPYLESQGISCELRELVGPELYRILYRPGHRLEKVVRFTRGALERLRDVRDASAFDVVFVHREAFPFGPAFIESWLAKSGKPIVYDFDDSIYLPSGNPTRDFVRRPDKTNTIIHLARHVIVCNEHLRNFCLAYNANVSIVRTSVDTETQFLPREYPERLPPEDGRPVRLGWIGSHSTAPYLLRLAPVLGRLAQRYPIELLVVGAGRDISIPGVSTINKPWSLSTEVDDFRSLDIGLYPLENGVWERGKTSFKTIQYMAVGVPGVISRVGAACDIVKEGENGLLADGEDEWIAKLSRLIEEPALRRELGANGRLTAERDFSVRSNAPRIAAVLRAAAG
jgi:glycosyltransferase involved in cell wall biosynthesis